MQLSFSFVIPVYNRPEETKELLDSFRQQTFTGLYEIIIVEDGSTLSSETIVQTFSDLPVTYLSKSNSGPGPSRNYGMQRARGNYFIILDSDCILPPEYLQKVANSLSQNYTDFFGGPDAAHESFSTVQKAINYSMTSFLTTGGIRGRAKSVDNFQPRSFNMGISKIAFDATAGFGKIHPGEDPDLTMRLWDLGFKSKLIPEAYVYHKRRISWKKFYQQVRKFGLVRPILTKWHPKSGKITYWFPSLFVLFSLLSVLILFFGNYLPILAVFIYFLVIFIHATFSTKNIQIGVYSVVATIIQFSGYGFAFLESTFHIQWQKKLPQKQFPHLFFK
ncbi:MAG: glycosyltransferase [Leeuwenhoekiella sp.]